MRPTEPFQPLTLVVAGDPTQRTGGYRYDARIVEGLRRRGHSVEVIGLEGAFPEGDERAARALESTLAAQPDGRRVIIDGLALGNLPAVAVGAASRLVLIALVHHPLGDEAGLTADQRARYLANERRALAVMDRIVVTSPFTARRLRELGVERPIHVVEPGVDPAPLAARAWPAPPGQPPVLLCVATLTPRKGHALLLDALERLDERPWRCRLLGAEDRDPTLAAALRRRARESGLDDRLSFEGECDEDALAAAYHEADLLVLPSFYEGYGMVVTEALARGLPVLTTCGGALTDTLPAEAGWCVPPGDSNAFYRALRNWFDAPEQRDARRAGAVKARRRLSDWPAAAANFAAVLEEMP